VAATATAAGFVVGIDDAGRVVGFVVAGTKVVTNSAQAGPVRAAAANRHAANFVRVVIGTSLP